MTVREIEIDGHPVPIQEDQIYMFQKEIERRVIGNDMSYIEAVAEYCEEHDVEYDSIVNLLSGRIKHEISLEASKYNLLKEKMPNPLW